MNTCYLCQGTVRPKRVTHMHHWKGKPFTFKDVPADVCQQCGEVYFAPNVLKAMDQIAEGGQEREPEKEVLVPVYSLSGL